MQINEILSRLDRTEGRFPHDAVRESIVRREEMTPALLGIRSDGGETEALPTFVVVVSVILCAALTEKIG